MKKRKGMRSFLAVMLCAGMILQGGLASAYAAVVPAGTRVNDSSEYSISVTPETARYYLEKIAEIDKSVQAGIEPIRKIVPGYSLSNPYILFCRDIDRDGEDELIIYDRISLAHLDAEGMDGDYIEFHIYSSNGEVYSEYADVVRHAGPIDVYYAVVDSYVIGTYSRYHDLDYGATLYKLEGGKLHEIQKRICKVDWLGDGDITYTDASGVMRYAESGEYTSLPRYDLLGQIIEEAKKRGVNFSDGLIIQEEGEEFKPLEVTLDGERADPIEDAQINTELIKKELQHIVDADARGQNVIQPTSSVYQDIVDTLMIWDVAFVQEQFDLTLGEFPTTRYLFDWFADEASVELIHLDTKEKRRKFSANISPVFEEALSHYYDNYGDYCEVYKLDKNIINQYLYALYGNDFDVEKYYNTKKYGTYELALTKDGQLYAWQAQEVGGGTNFNVTAVSDMGDGFYLAHLNDYSAYGGILVGDESHVLLRKAPEDAELKYHIVKCSNGTQRAVRWKRIQNTIMEKLHGSQTGSSTWSIWKNNLRD